MPSAAIIRQTIEAALAARIPSALTPAPRTVHPVSPTGIAAVDEVLSGGLPVGAITELTGPKCSGRTSLALSFLARITAVGGVAAWVDVSDSLEPESAAAAGVDLSRLLWVRCGTASPKPRSEVSKPWKRIEQGLRAMDLLLQAGGFAAVVVDMGGIDAKHVTRVPLAAWFRARAAAERSQTSLLLLTEYPCAKSSAGLMLRFKSEGALEDERTVFTGMRYQMAVERLRFAPTNVVPMRKPPQSARQATWQSRVAWAGAR